MKSQVIKYIPKLIILIGVLGLGSTVASQSIHRQYLEIIENNLIPAIEIAGMEKGDRSIAARMEHFNVPGVSVAYFSDGKIQWTRCYGVRDVVSGEPVDENTVFQAASISKPVAAAGALTMVEDGLLDLDADINDFLKGWQVAENKYTEVEDVTLRRLMTHNAGLTVHGFAGYKSIDDVPDVVQILDGVSPANSAAITPDTFPGAIWRYSGGGYTVMQKAMEDVTRQPFPELMHERVLAKTGMTRSTYQQPLPEIWGNSAHAHRGNGGPMMGQFHTYPEMAAAGLWTTPSDLARFAIAVQNAYHGTDTKWLSQAMARQMLTEQFDDWGLGPGLRIKGDTLAFSHGGSNAGFRCILFAFAEPVTDGVVIMTNGDNGGSLMSEILRAVSHTYNWDAFNPRVKEVIPFTEQQGEVYAGTYTFDEGYAIEVAAATGGLEVTTLWDQQVLMIRPESETDWFDENDWTPFVFSFDDKGQVESVLVAGRRTGTKQDK